MRDEGGLKKLNLRALAALAEYTPASMYHRRTPIPARVDLPGLAALRFEELRRHAWRRPIAWPSTAAEPACAGPSAISGTPDHRTRDVRPDVPPLRHRRSCALLAEARDAALSRLHHVVEEVGAGARARRRPDRQDDPGRLGRRPRRRLLKRRLPRPAPATSTTRATSSALMFPPNWMFDSGLQLPIDYDYFLVEVAARPDERDPRSACACPDARGGGSHRRPWRHALSVREAGSSQIRPWPSGSAAQRSVTRMTLEALADVDAGCLIDHQAMIEWAVILETDTPLPLPAA